MFLNRAARTLSGESAGDLVGVAAETFLADAPDVAEAIRRCADEQVEITRERKHQFQREGLRAGARRLQWLF